MITNNILRQLDRDNLSTEIKIEVSKLKDLINQKKFIWEDFFRVDDDNSKIQLLNKVDNLEKDIKNKINTICKLHEKLIVLR